MEKILYNQVGEIKGKEDKLQDSFSFQFTPQNENLKRTRGSLFSLVTVKGEDSDRIGKATSFYQTFQSSYYAKSTGSIIKSLSDTLESVDQIFNKREAEDSLSHSLITAVLWGSVLYLAKLGEGSVFIARGGKVKELEFNKVASGVLENQDTVCLASKSFAENVQTEELSAFLTLENFEKSLVAIDKRIADMPGACCVVIRLSVDEPETKPTELEIGQVDEEGKFDFTQEETKADDSDKSKESTASELEKAEEEIGSTEPAVTTKSKEKFFDKITSKILPFLKQKAQKVFESIKKPWVRRNPGEHVDHVAIRRQRIFQIVSLVVIILLLSLLFGVFGKDSAKKNDKISAFINNANNKLTEAANIKTIDPLRAKNLVNQAEKDIEAAKKIDPNNTKVKDLETKEAVLFAEITRTYSVNNLTTFFDLTSFSSNAKATRIAIASKALFVSDKEGKSLYSVDTEKKKGEKISGSLNSPENLATITNGLYIQTNSGVEKLDLKSGSISNLLENQDWGEISGAASYQGNLYLLDKGKNTLWKYLSLSSGLSTPRSYLTDSVDLSKGSGIAIDGFVWVSTEDGKIYKFSQGKKQDFVVTNFTDTFKKVVDIYTDSDSDNLYILDKGKGSVTIVSKNDGIYQSQYTNDKLKSAVSLVVEESKKTVYFAAEGKIYSFTLR
jgi:hypothetical protein